MEQSGAVLDDAVVDDTERALTINIPLVGVTGFKSSPGEIRSRSSCLRILSRHLMVLHDRVCPHKWVKVNVWHILSLRCCYSDSG